jgi:hypothetical protein
MGGRKIDQVSWSKKASEKSLLGFFNKDFSKRSAYDPRTSASEKLLFRQFLKGIFGNEALQL